MTRVSAEILIVGQTKLTYVCFLILGAKSFSQFEVGFSYFLGCCSNAYLMLKKVNLII